MGFVCVTFVLSATMFSLYKHGLLDQIIYTIYSISKFFMIVWLYAGLLDKPEDYIIFSKWDVIAC